MTSAKAAIIFKARSDFDRIDTEADLWAKAVAAEGIAPIPIDLRRADSIPAIVRTIRSRPVAFFLSINGFGLPQPEQGVGFYGDCAAPVFVHFIDHPIYLAPLIRSPVPQLFASFASPGEVSFCRRRIRGDIPLLHLPHAAAPAVGRPWGERDLPVLLAGSIHQQPEEMRAGWIEKGPEVRDILESILAAHRANPAKPLHDSVLTVAGSAVAESPTLLFSYYSAVDMYLRSAVRVDFIRSAARLPIALVGRGWDAVVPDGFRGRQLGLRPFGEVLTMMARAKIVLNLLPPYLESHERLFQAMAHGAVPATAAAPWLLNAVGQNALLPLPGDAGASAALINAALEDDGALAARGAAGTAAFLAGHTYRHRLARALQWMKAVGPAHRPAERDAMG